MRTAAEATAAPSGRNGAREENGLGPRPEGPGAGLNGPLIAKQPRRPGRPEIAAFLIAGAFFAALGQALLPLLEPAFRWRAIGLTGLGLALFAVSVGGLVKGRLPWPFRQMVAAFAGWLVISPWQAVVLALAPLFSLAAWLAAGDRWLMNLPTFAVGAWLLAMILILVGSRRGEQPMWKPRWPKAEVIAFLGILLAACFLRVLWLEDIPWLFTGDEGSSGISAVDFLQGRQNNIFVMGWFSFPSMYFFVESMAIRVFGQTIFAARLPAAIAGTLTAAGLYVFARAAFGRWVALASMAYFAAFPIHVHFSRAGLNNIWDALTLVVVSAGLWLAWERNHLALFALAGLALGLGQYFYPTSRGLYAILLAWFVTAAIFDRRRLRQRLAGVAVMILASITAVLPLLLFYAQHPNEYLAPFVRVSIFGGWMRVALQESQGRWWLVLWDQFRSSALAFGGVFLRGHYNAAPMLLPVATSLFLLGTALAAFQLPAMQHAWILIWLTAAVATGALSQSPPSSQRYLFAAPAVAVLVALPVVQGVRWISGIWPRARPWMAAAGAICLAALIWADLSFYFGVYSGAGRFGDRNTEVANRVAEYLSEHEPGIRVYFAGAPRMGYYTHKTIRFLVPASIGVDISSPLAAPPDYPLIGPTAFIVLPERSSDLDYIRRSYPNGSLELVDARDGTPLFYGYYVSPP